MSAANTWKLPDTPEQRRIAYLEELLSRAHEEIGWLRSRLLHTEAELAKERAR